jgi:hypothetical protein
MQQGPPPGVPERVSFFFASMIVGSFVLAPGTHGMIDASTTRSPGRPIRRP